MSTPNNLSILFWKRTLFTPVPDGVRGRSFPEFSG